MVSTIEYTNLIGGLDTRVSNEKQKEKISFTFWEEGKNVEAVGSQVRMQRGNKNILDVALPTNVYMRSIGSFESRDQHYMMGISSDGHLRLWSEMNKALASVKSGLSTNAKPFLFPWSEQVCVMTGYDDPFVYDPSAYTFENTGLFDQIGVYGDFGFTYKGRMFIVDNTEGNVSLRYSALGNYKDWTTEKDAGRITNFYNDRSKILAAEKAGEFIVLHKKDQSYLLRGSNYDDLLIEPYRNRGAVGKDARCIFNEAQYFWNNGLYAIGNYGELGQLSISDELSFRIHNHFSDIDLTREDQIKIVPYEENNQILIYVPITGSANLTRCYIADFNRNESVRFWYRESQALTCACCHKNTIYSCTPDGKLLEEFTGRNFDGSVINSELKLPSLDLGKQSRKKKIEFLMTILSSLNSGEVILTVDRDNRNAPSERDLWVKVDSFTWGDLWGSATWGSSDKYYYKKSIIRPEFRTLQLGIKTDTLGQDFALEGFGFINVDYV